MSAPRSLQVLRVLVTLHVLAVFGQPVWAGMLLSGHYEMLNWHAIGAYVVIGLSFLQVIASGVHWKRTGVRWPAGWSALLLVGEALQYNAGFTGRMSLHIPLGVALVVICALLLTALWRPVAAPTAASAG